jgi:uncharacterized protein (TIGR00251 family)
MKRGTVSVRLRVEVTVTPSSGRQKIFLDAQGRLKCYLKSPPEKGKANNELIAFFAKQLRLPRVAIELVAGATSRKKIISIEGVVSRDELYKLLGIEKQGSLFEINKD